MMRASVNRRRWIAVITGGAALHTVVVRALGSGTYAEHVWTDLELLTVSAIAAIASFRTALRSPERHIRTAWMATGAGVAAWWAAALIWSVRELVLGDVAPAPSWYDAPFFGLAPSFALALIFYRRNRPSRALQLRQIADLGIVTATIAIVGTLILAGPIRSSEGSPYVFVAIGYPGFYLAVVLVGLVTLGRGSWSGRRNVLAILVWAHLVFAAVDLLYGAKVLTSVYQTGIEDTLWVIGMLSVWWATFEERALLEVPARGDLERDGPSWNGLVGAITMVALGALSADALGRLGGAEWWIIAVASAAAAGFVGMRMWANARMEVAYEGAVADKEAMTHALTAEQSRLRAVGSLAGGTAHELNNLLQAIAGNLALLRRRAARGEDIQTYLASIERALGMLGKEVSALRELAPSEDTLGMVVLLPGGDPDAQLAAVLAGAGFAPASLPDVDAAVRASKGGEIRAIVSSPAEAIELHARGVTVPVVTRDSEDLVPVVVRIVALISVP